MASFIYTPRAALNNYVLHSALYEQNAEQSYRVLPCTGLVMDFQSLTDVGYSAGFYDQAHFIKAFRNFTGQNPEEYFSKR